MKISLTAQTKVMNTPLP